MKPLHLSPSRYCFRQSLRLALTGLFAAGALTTFSDSACAQNKDKGGAEAEVDVAPPPAKAMLPVAPRQLLQALPDKMENWELTRSTSEHQYGTWLETRAVREYEREIKAQDGEAPLLAETKISIVDTGAYTGSLAMFADFTEGKDERVERKFLKGKPAFIIGTNDERREVRMLADKRFVVRIVTENQSQKFLGEWIKRIDFRKLTSFPDTNPVKLPETLRIVCIDQLSPRKNRTYELATTSSALLDEDPDAE